MTIKEPLISKPIFFEKVWGNNILNSIFNKNELNPIGESWLYSPYNNKQTELVGLLSDVIYGKAKDVFPNFDLLIKLISTSDWLSIQVHPNDLMAKKLENKNNGKTEAWVFLNNNGKVKVSTENEKIFQALSDNKWDNALKEINMNKNDLIFLPSGTVHTLGPSSTLLEIQQNSDITYRLYDWGRIRELHLEKAKKVLKNIDSSYSLIRNFNNFTSKYFSIKKIKNKYVRGFGVFVDTENYQTIVLPEKFEYFLEGEYIEFNIREEIRL